MCYFNYGFNISFSIIPLSITRSFLAFPIMFSSSLPIFLPIVFILLPPHPILLVFRILLVSIFVKFIISIIFSFFPSTLDWWALVFVSLLVWAIISFILSLFSLIPLLAKSILLLIFIRPFYSVIPYFLMITLWVFISRFTVMFSRSIINLLLL